MTCSSQLADLTVLQEQPGLVYARQNRRSDTPVVSILTKPPTMPAVCRTTSDRSGPASSLCQSPLPGYCRAPQQAGDDDIERERAGPEHLRRGSPDGAALLRRGLGSGHESVASPARGPYRVTRHRHPMAPGADDGAMRAGPCTRWRASMPNGGMIRVLASRSARGSAPTRSTSTCKDRPTSSSASTTV
jgi:hypothetical protein